jgi:ribosomal protein L37E
MAMRLCELTTTKIREDAWHHKCKVCGKEEVLTTEKWFTPCGIQLNTQGTTVAAPGLARKAVSVASELARWTAAGSPRRSEERVRELFAICRECPLYQGDEHTGICRACGCGLSPARYVTNKIMMATTRCPVGKWEAEA